MAPLLDLGHQFQGLRVARDELQSLLQIMLGLGEAPRPLEPFGFADQGFHPDQILGPLQLLSCAFQCRVEGNGLAELSDCSLILLAIQ